MLLSSRRYILKGKMKLKDLLFGNKNRTKHTIWIAITVAIVAFLWFEAGRLISYTNNKFTESAHDDFCQSIDQIENVMYSTWIADASNIKEMSSVLANTDNKDTVMKDIVKNDIVYRYLFVEAKQTEAVASDGTNVQRDDTHQFTELAEVSGIETSEAFQSKMGAWCYLYRCPVVKGDTLYGYIYAQYLYERMRDLMPTELYQGSGNCYLYDRKSDKFVFQIDSERYYNTLGMTASEWDSLHDITKDELVENVNFALKEGILKLIPVKTLNENILIYIKPSHDGNYCLVGVVNEADVMNEVSTVKKALLAIVFTLVLAVVVVLVVVLYFKRIRDDARRIIELEREEHSRQLQEALETANNANHSKSEFLAHMSHEIRTPINAVIGMNEMVLRETNDKNIISYATDIDNAAHSLLDIVNDILDISKIESGKMEIINAEYKLGTLIENVCSVITLKAKAKKLDLIVNVDEKLPSVLLGDDIRIRQIIINLLTNAVKYTQEGKIILSVMGETDSHTARLSFIVEDTGIGIKEEDLPKLAEKFQRIEESRNRNIEGTGLGMSITIQLLKLMGSRLEVDSIYGEGSKFWFELEQKIVDNSEIGPVNIKEKTKPNSTKKYKASFTAPDARILVVDDNKVNVLVFANLLKQTSMSIDMAYSGMQCLELAKENKYDIIFLDHMMPEMDGIETLSRLRDECDINKDTPVIALTANAIIGAREQYMDAGFTNYLSKPFEPVELELMIVDIIPPEKINKV